MLSRATACPTAEVARVVQAALVQQLRPWGETDAEIWFDFVRGSATLRSVVLHTTMAWRGVGRASHRQCVVLLVSLAN